MSSEALLEASEELIAKASALEWACQMQHLKDAFGNR
jgi:hypothetical protein